MGNQERWCDPTRKPKEFTLTVCLCMWVDVCDGERVGWRCERLTSTGRSCGKVPERIGTRKSRPSSSAGCPIRRVSLASEPLRGGAAIVAVRGQPSSSLFVSLFPLFSSNRNFLLLLPPPGNLCVYTSVRPSKEKQNTPCIHPRPPHRFSSTRTTTEENH